MQSRYDAEKIHSLENELNDFYQSKGVYLKPRTDFVKMAVQLGFGVFTVKIKGEVDGLIYVKDGERKIGVNTNIKGKDLQYVVAHELGHYIRQLKNNNGIESDVLIALKDHIFHNEEKAPLENEMDYLAAAMLVPMWHFSKMIKSLGIGNDVNYDNVEEKVNSELVNLLAGYYGVSDELIRRRIAEAVEYGKVA